MLVFCHVEQYGQHLYVFHVEQCSLCLAVSGLLEYLYGLVGVGVCYYPVVAGGLGRCVHGFFSHFESLFRC